MDKLKSFAKINLYLHIKGKQGDFHLLNSVMILLDLHDAISIKKSSENQINLNSKFKEKIPQEKNIINKILKKIEQDFNIKDKFTITIEKNIPISAGLGGGSSNAATVLQFLNNYYNLNLTKKYLKEIALTIGADIPFFFYGKNALVQGIGEQITPKNIELQNYYILLCNPLFPISTAQVFKNFAPQKEEKELINPKNIAEIIKFGKNDLEETIRKLYPQINLYINTLKQTNSAYIQISGTGATIFALYQNQQELQKAQQTIQNSFPDMWIFSQNLKNPQ